MPKYKCEAPIKLFTQSHRTTLRASAKHATNQANNNLNLINFVQLNMKIVNESIPTKSCANAIKLRVLHSSPVCTTCMLFSVLTYVE